MNPPTRSIRKSLFSRNRYLGLLAAGTCVLLFSGAAQAGVVWEYKVVDANLHNRQLETMLNAQGAGGWELVLITRQGVAVFKHRK